MHASEAEGMKTWKSKQSTDSSRDVQQKLGKAVRRMSEVCTEALASITKTQGVAAGEKNSAA